MEQDKNLILQIEAALMGVRWNSDDDKSTLFFFPTSSPGARGVMRAGDNTAVFKIPLEYEVVLKNDAPYLHIIDNKKGETFEYKIETVSKPLRKLTIVDEGGRQSSFQYI